MPRILLVDDQGSVRQGLRMRLALEADMEVVGEASDGVEALFTAKRLTPDIVVMDVEMPHMDGITATRQLREAMPQIAVIMLSIHGDRDARESAREAGAVAFVEKRGGLKPLLDAIHEVKAVRVQSDPDQAEE
jgi:DNA-binding NarL/FixJ family response regulator